MKQYDVFISYSRDDYVDKDKNVIPGNIVAQIKNFLATHGYSYWFDEEGVYSGDAFVKTITEAIQDSEIFLFISTKASNSSKWTNHEIATAKLLGKKTIPFRVDGSMYDTSILMYLAPLDYIDYANNPDKAFNALGLSLKHHFDKIKESELKRKEEEERRLKQKEIEDAQKESERKLKQRLIEIDDEISDVELSIQKCDNDRNELINKVDVLKKQISDYESELVDIAKSRNVLCAKIESLEREKNSILGKSPTSMIVEKGRTAPPPLFYISKLLKYRSSRKNADDSKKTVNHSIFYGWIWDIRNLKPRYWFHIFTLICLVLAIITFFPLAMRGRDRFYICEEAIFPGICAIISIYGLIQLLRGKKDGMLILLFNTITFFWAWYLESNGTLYAYAGSCIYLFMVFLIFALHKTDKSSRLSWGRMTKTSLKYPKRVLMAVAFISLISSIAMPVLYAKHCKLKYAIFTDADYLLAYSVKGLIGDNWCCEVIADFYMPGDHWVELENNFERALWWYELANDDAGVEECRQHIEAKNKGWFGSSVYGKCGLNKITDSLVKISIDSWFDVDGIRQTYSGGGIQYGLRYCISLIGADFSQGRLVVDGASASLDSVDYNTQELYFNHCDSVPGKIILKFIQDHEIISERVVPVKKMIHKWFDSSVYGKCGLNKITNSIVKINIDSSSDGSPFSGDSVQCDHRYYITLIGADFSQGRLVIDGAKGGYNLRYVDYNTQELFLKCYDLVSDEITLKFIQGHETISKRVVPVKDGDRRKDNV